MIIGNIVIIIIKEGRVLLDCTDLFFSFFMITFHSAPVYLEVCALQLSYYYSYMESASMGPDIKTRHYNYSNDNC